MGMNTQMDPKTKQLIEEASCHAIPRVGGQVDGATTARELIHDLITAVKEQDKRARHAEDERDLFGKRIDELEAKLAEAVDLASEAIPYVSDYFRTKYELDARLAKLLPSTDKLTE